MQVNARMILDGLDEVDVTCSMRQLTLRGARVGCRTFVPMDNAARLVALPSENGASVSTSRGMTTSERLPS